MELRDAPNTLGLGKNTIVEMSKDDPEWLYQEADLRIIGKTAYTLYESTGPDGKSNVEQVSHISAAPGTLLTLM